MHPKTASAFRLLLSSCAFAAWLAIASPPLGADDFVIDDDETQQSGGFTINGDDTLTITETGSVTYDATDSAAVRVRGNNNEVTNYGNVIATGNKNYGVRFSHGSNNTLTNYGLISVTGDEAAAVHWQTNGSDNIFINHGRLEAHGESSAAFYATWAVNSQEVYNYGTVFVTGDYTDGLVVGSNRGSLTENWGTIHTTGFGAQGIHNFGGITPHTIRNYGTIITEGKFAYGILAPEEGSTVENHGLIHIKGKFGNGIDMGGGLMTIINSGTIIVENDQYAIRFYHANDYRRMGQIVVVDPEGPNNLSLLEGSFLAGRLKLDEGTYLDIETEYRRSVLWNFEGDVMDGAPIITGPGQSFFNPDTVQFATLDPAVLGGNANQLGHIQNLLSSIGRRGFDRSDAPVMQIADASGSTGLDLAWFHDIRPWVGAFGGQYEHSADEMMFAHDIEFRGAALGVSARMGRAFRLAFTAGYFQGTQEAHGQYSNSYSLETDGIFAGIATRYRLWDMDFDFGIMGAMLNYESERFVQDNLAPMGRGYPKASYDGWLISPEIGISAPINLSDIVTVRPALRVAYTHHAIPSYSEDDRGQLTVDDQTLALLSTTAEITVEKKLFGIATVHATGGYTMRTNVGDTSASVTLVGVSQDFELPDTDGEAYFVGGGLTVDVWDTVRLAAEATVIEGKDYTGIEGMARVSVAF